jgi:RNA polymerase sigma-70 factor
MFSEDQFMSQINRKETRAFKILFEDFYTPLVIYALRFVEEQSTAEDIVQELITDLWESPSKYASFIAFRSFLYHSVRNRCLNYLKHKEVEKRYISYTMAHANTSDEDEQQEIEEEVYRLLFKAIRELPEKCKAVFELHLAGKKNEEIASTLQISILTVKSQKQKALRQLKEKMGNLFYILLFLEII